MFHWINHQYWFNIGANYWQWVTSIVALAGWGMYFHARFGQKRCEHCWREGVVPVTGSVHKHCKIHAAKCGTTHS